MKREAGRRLIVGMALIMVMPLPRMATSQTRADEEKLLRQAFEEYRQAVIQERFEDLWSFLLPEIQRKIDQAYERLSTDAEYREEFVTTNWCGLSDEEVQVVKLGLPRKVFIALAKYRGCAYGEEFDEGFEAGKIKRVGIGEVRWIPELGTYTPGILLESYYKQRREGLSGRAGYL